MTFPSETFPTDQLASLHPDLLVELQARLFIAVYSVPLQERDGVLGRTLFDLTIETGIPVETLAAVAATLLPVLKLPSDKPPPPTASRGRPVIPRPSRPAGSTPRMTVAELQALANRLVVRGR